MFFFFCCLFLFALCAVYDNNGAKAHKARGLDFDGLINAQLGLIVAGHDSVQDLRIGVFTTSFAAINARLKCPR